RRMIDRRGGVHTYDYDDRGKLKLDTAPGLASQSLEETRFIIEEGELLVGQRVTHRSPEERVSSYTLSLDGGSIRRTIEHPDGAEVTAILDKGLRRTVERSDGTEVTEQYGVHQLHGLASPHRSTATTRLPSNTTREESYTQEDTETEWIEDALLNGRLTRSVTPKTARTTTVTSAAGRQTVVTYDDQRRPIQIQVGNLAPVTLSYDALGRLEHVTAIGDLLDTRTTDYEYFPVSSAPQSGYLQRI